MAYTTKQLKAVNLLAQGESIADTARHVSVSRKTIYQWQDLDGFKQAVRAQTSENLLSFGKRVIHLLNNNLQTVEEIMTSKRASNSDRLRAYGILMSNIKTLSELGDLNERITRLENGQTD